MRLLPFINTFFALSVLGWAESANCQNASVQGVLSDTIRLAGCDYEFRVWMPDVSAKKSKYDVIYMQDGQMLFDSATTWNKTEWKVDETLSELQAKGVIPPTMVVAMYNRGKRRHADYFPQDIWPQIDSSLRDSVGWLIRQRHKGTDFDTLYANDYLDQIARIIIPYVDSLYPTHRTAHHRWLAGASMGGLFSQYAIVKKPSLFAGAICLSTHWITIYRRENNPIPDLAIGYFEQYSKALKKKRIYFDSGDQNLDALYNLANAQLQEALKRMDPKGKTKKFTLEPGQGHDEASWAVRFRKGVVWVMGRGAEDAGS